MKIILLTPLLLNNSRGGVLASIIIIFLGIWLVQRYRWKQELLIVISSMALGGLLLLFFPVKLYSGVPQYSAKMDIEHMQVDRVQNLGISKFFSPFHKLSEFEINNKPNPEVRNTPKTDQGTDSKSKVNTDQKIDPITLSRRIDYMLGKPGTAYARLATWKITVEYVIDNNAWFFGAPYGSNIVQEACSNPDLPNYGAPFPGGGLTHPKCPIDANEIFSPTRDVHNAIVTIFLYNGIFGLSLFLGLIYRYVSQSVTTSSSISRFAKIALLGYAVSGFFSTFALASFILLPVTYFLAIIYSFKNREYSFEH
jgi:hypothetical protein